MSADMGGIVAVGAMLYFVMLTFCLEMLNTILFLSNIIEAYQVIVS